MIPVTPWSLSWQWLLVVLLTAFLAGVGWALGTWLVAKLTT
jgi:hypothetical protein